MSKKIIIIFIAIHAAPLYGEFRWYNPLSWRVQHSEPIDMTKYYGGVASNNVVEVSKNIKETAELFLKDPQKTGEVVNSVTHGAGYGIVSGPVTAIKDGTVYLYNLPYGPQGFIAAGTITAGYVVKKTYEAYNPSEEDQLRQRIKIAELQAQETALTLITKTSDLTSQFSTCLNTYSRDEDRSTEGIPKKCNSQARRLAELNQKKADEMVSIFKKYQ